MSEGLNAGDVYAVLRLKDELSGAYRTVMGTMRTASADTSRSIGTIASELVKAETEVKKLKQEIAGFTSSTGPGFRAATAVMLDDAIKKTVALRGEFKKAKDELSDPGRPSFLQRLTDDSYRTVTALRNVGTAWTTAITAPIVAAGVASGKFASDFEADMLRVHTLSGVTIEDQQMMRRAIMELAPAVGIGPDALAKAMLAVTSTGIRGAQAVDILTISAKASASGLGEAATIARTITSIIQAYGSENITAAKAAEVMFKTVKDGNAEASGLAGTLGRVVGIAAEVGVSFEDVGTFIATFTRLGVDSAEAVTALRGTLSTIIKPTKGAREALADVGLTIEDLREQIQTKGLTRTLVDLVATFKGNEEGLSHVIPNVRALAGVLGTAGAQAKNMADIEAHLKAQTDELSGAFNETAETAQHKWNAMKAELQVVAIEIGDHLLPQFKALVEQGIIPGIKWVEDLVHKWEQLPEPVKLFTEAVVIGLAAGGPVLMALGGLARAITSIQVLLFGASAVSNMSVGAFLLGLGPWAAGAALVGGAAYGIRKMAPFDDTSKLPNFDLSNPDYRKLLNYPTLPGGPGSGPTNGLGPLNVTGVGARSSGYLAGSQMNVTAMMAEAQAAMAAAKAGKEHKKAVDEVAVALENARQRTLPLTESQEAQANSLMANGVTSHKAIAKEIGAYIGQIDALVLKNKAADDSWKSLIDSVAKVNDEIARGKISNITGIGTIDKPTLPASLKLTDGSRLPSLPDVAQAGKDAADALEALNRRGERALDGLAQSFAQLGQVAGGSLGGVLSGVGQMLVMLKAAQEQSKLYRSNAGVASALFSSSASKTEKAQAFMASAAAIAQGAQAVWGATSQYDTRTKNAGAGAMAGAQAGAAFGPWGVAIGAAAGLVVGLVRGKPEWARAADEVARDFGTKISRGLSDQIAKDAKELFSGSRQAASLFNLGSIIKEDGGANANNVVRYAGRLHDVFSMVEKHQMTITQAQKVLDETFAELATAATDSYGFLSRQMREIIDLDERFGTHSKAVSDYLKQQADIAMNASSGVIASLESEAGAWKELADKIAQGKKDSKDVSELLKTQTGLASQNRQRLEDMGIVAVAAFASAIRAGKSFSEAIAAAGPGLARLSDAFKALGIDTENAGLKALMLQGSILQNNPTLINGVSSLGAAFAALSNTGMLNVDTFAAMERAGYDMYVRVQSEVAKVGGSSRDALLPMQDYLHQAEEAARQLGIPLDGNTQMLIEQSKELGIWQAKGKSATDKLIDGFQGVVDKLQQFIDRLLGIPPEVNTNVVTNYSQTGEPPNYTPGTSTGENSPGSPNYVPGGPEGFATGTPGLGFRDFRTGKTVRLHGIEAVVPRSRAVEFATGVLGGGGAYASPQDRGGDMTEQIASLRAAMVRVESAIERSSESVRDAVLSDRETQVNVDGDVFIRARHKALEYSGPLVAKERQLLGLS